MNLMEYFHYLESQKIEGYHISIAMVDGSF